MAVGVPTETQTTTPIINGAAVAVVVGHVEMEESVVESGNNKPSKKSK